MQNATTKIEKPQRWDAPFGPSMTTAMVEQLMQISPFREMDESAFSSEVPLRGILQMDCRINQYRRGEIVLREGDYGHSAFLILAGELLVSLQSLPAHLLGRPQSEKKSFFESLSQLWSNSRHPEVRRQARHQDDSQIRTDGNHDRTRVFLQDVPRTLELSKTEILQPGEIFGELAALTRSQRSATVVSKDDSVVVEIRWQGLRELMKRDPALRQYIDKEYREHGLRAHLRETEMLRNLPTETIEQLADQVQFESYGNFAWSQQFESARKQDVAEQIRSEPVIAEQGEYPNGFILVRNGFARLSRRFGTGHQTIAYLGKGDSFGIRELAHNWRSDEQQAWTLSLRAVGYVDVLRIPTDAMEKLVFPNLKESEMPAPLSKRDSKPAQSDRRQQKRDASVAPDLLEFLMDHRFVNGTQAMMIDMNRCTRCDDCVRACASTHDNNPRFVRTGPIHNGLMVANACMHCADPVCMIGCPTGAIGRDEITGSVMINDLTCIGCSTCANSCPYDNIKMVNIRDAQGQPFVDQQSGMPIEKATKCDLCSEQMGGPACQRACPHDALVRLDLSNPEALAQWINS